jgi:putative SOS response-associated peptidase YedK
MCGRYTLTSVLDALMEHFGIDQISFEYVPRYNIAPGQMLPAIIAHEGRRRMGQLRWGLIPSWAKDEKIGFQLINAKSETVNEKPSFKESFLRRRCMIPADSFYEWKREGNAKQPMRIMLKNGAHFAMAGLYDSWTSPDGQKIHSCTIITTRANELVRPIHDRMPVILGEEAADTWLNRDVRDAALLQSLLQPFPADEMKAYPVSAKVGSAKNDSPECIERIDGIESATLF